MTKRIILYLLIQTTLSFTVISQNRAPSCWLKYPDNYSGDMIINTIRVISPSPTYTYYCTLQWNAGAEGGGYCGIQEHPDGRNFIFSIWDPKASNEAITAPYTHESTEIETFGGEGTGLKSWNFGIGWETDQWYSFVARAWSQDSHTMFGYWVYSYVDDHWYHLVTMDYPVPDVRFNSSTGSFIEDWLGNGQLTREVHHKDGWKRRSGTGEWYPFNSAYFERVSPDAGAENYINSYDGGVIAEHFFMKSGGSASPVTNSSKTTLNLTNSKVEPGFETGYTEQFSLLVNENTLSVSWAPDPAKTPQFSVQINIYDDPGLSGEPLLELKKTVPELRQCEIDISSLNDNSEYYLSFIMTDLLDRSSEPVAGQFIKGALSIRNKNTNSFQATAYPNPFNESLMISRGSFDDNIGFVFSNLNGKVITRQKSLTDNQINIPYEINRGVYILTLFTEEYIKTIKILKN